MENSISHLWWGSAILCLIHMGQTVKLSNNMVGWEVFACSVPSHTYSSSTRMYGSVLSMFNELYWVIITIRKFYFRTILPPGSFFKALKERRLGKRVIMHERRCHLFYSFVISEYTSWDHDSSTVQHFAFSPSALHVYSYLLNLSKALRYRKSDGGREPLISNPINRNGATTNHYLLIFD